MNIKLLTKHHLEFLSLKRGYKGSFESILVKMPHVENLMSWLKCCQKLLYRMRQEERDAKAINLMKLMKLNTKLL